MTPLRRRDLLIGGAGAAMVGTVLAQGGGAGAAGADSAPWSVVDDQTPVRLAVSEQTHKPFVLPLLKQIAEAAGLQWELLFLPWPRALLGAQLGQHLVFGLSRNPARDKLFAYSQPVFVSRGWLVVPKAKPIRFDRLEDLRGHALCVPRGSTYGPAFEEARRQQLFRVENGGNDLGGRARMLAIGRCDAMLATHRGSAAALERRLRALRTGVPFQVLPKPVVEEGILFAAAKGSEAAALLPRLDEAVARSRAAIQALVDSAL
ncbi:substrate-binding periplasmic protein [Roseateles chitinivorans]|uniref:substrate-binding periplasmic protein n=1 Tax=Roseateles chitinivorans TaxID=2917965 RepID=UPI003D66E06D